MFKQLLSFENRDGFYAPVLKFIKKSENHHKVVIFQLSSWQV